MKNTIILFLVFNLLPLSVFAQVGKDVKSTDSVACKSADGDCAPTATAKELRALKVEQSQFEKICRATVESDPVCLRLKPEKRLNCSDQGANNGGMRMVEDKLSSTIDNGKRLWQCLEGAGASVEELITFIGDIIKKMGSSLIKNKMDILKFFTNPGFAKKVLSEKGSKLSKTARAFLQSSAMYFTREYEKTEKRHKELRGFALMPLVLTETYSKVLTKFLVDFYQATIADTVEEWQCMNGQAKMHIMCKTITDFVFPPAALVAFIGGGAKAAKALLTKKGAFNKFKKAFSSMRNTDNVASTAAKSAATGSATDAASAANKSAAATGSSAADAAKDAAKAVTKPAAAGSVVAGAAVDSSDNIVAKASNSEIAPKNASTGASVPNEPLNLKETIKDVLPKAKAKDVEKLVAKAKKKFNGATDEDVALMLQQFSKGENGVKSVPSMMKKIDELQLLKIENPSLFAKNGVMSKGALANENELMKLLYVDEISKRGVPTRGPSGEFVRHTKGPNKGQVVRKQLPKAEGKKNLAIQKDRELMIKNEMDELNKNPNCAIN